MDFSKCVPQSSEYDLYGPFLHILRELEMTLNLCYDVDEIRINSAFRSPEYEKRRGRDGLSAHCFGKAVDIHCTNNKHRYHIIKFALQKGIHRIGIYKNFIHLDMADVRDNKSVQVIWYG